MKPSDGKRPKLPAQQLIILAVARFSEPLAMTSVYPYLPEMIEGFGVPKNEVARWAGTASAVFSFAQSAVAVPWGRASDHFGRKPIIIIGLCNAMATFLIWGMSTNLPMAIFARGLQGAASGNVGIIRTMVAELVPEKELQPRAFSLMPLVYSLGSVFGPAFGGFFAKPATQFPALFGSSWFFNKFPFALPNLLLACFFVVSCTTALLFLRETLETKRHAKDWGREMGKRLTRALGLKKPASLPGRRHGNGSGHGHGQRHRRRRRNYGQATVENHDEETGSLLDRVVSNTSSSYAVPPRKGPPPAFVTMSEVLTPQTQLVLACYTVMALHAVAYDQVLPVFLNYPSIPLDPAGRDANVHLPFVFKGGFGLGSSSIGTVFTVYGTACGLIQFLLFPPICNRWGVLNCYKACVATFPVVYLVTPFVALIADPNFRMATLFAVLLVKAFCVMFGFPCVTILFTNSAPDLRVLGTLNGIATTTSAIGRAVGPAITGLAFTWGVNHGTVLSSYWLIALIAALGAVPVWWIVEGEGPKRSSDSDDEDADDVIQDNGSDYDDDDDDDDYDDDSDDGRKTLVPSPAGEATVVTGSEPYDQDLAVPHQHQHHDLAVLDEEETDLERETPLLPKTAPGEGQDGRPHTHGAGYSTFASATNVRMRRLSNEGKNIEHIKR